MSARPDYVGARGTMIGLVAGSKSPLSDAFSRFVADLVARGWTRRDVHDLTRDVLVNEAVALGDPASDALFDFETALTGDCHPDCIVRFPGEPDDEQALVAWVRGGEWKTR
jgi:hypothetical protein